MTKINGFKGSGGRSKPPSVPRSGSPPTGSRHLTERRTQAFVRPSWASFRLAPAKIRRSTESAGVVRGVSRSPVDLSPSSQCRRPCRFCSRARDLSRWVPPLALPEGGRTFLGARGPDGRSLPPDHHMMGRTNTYFLSLSSLRRQDSTCAGKPSASPRARTILHSSGRASPSTRPRVLVFR